MEHGLMRPLLLHIAADEKTCGACRLQRSADIFVPAGTAYVCCLNGERLNTVSGNWRIRVRSNYCIAAERAAAENQRAKEPQCK